MIGFGQLDHLRDDLAVRLGRVAPILVLFLIGKRRGGVHFVDVHAGAERTAGAGQHDRPHALFQVQVAQSLGKLPEHGSRKRIPPLRPVEHDRADRAGHLHIDGVAGHEHWINQSLTQWRRGRGELFLLSRLSATSALCVRPSGYEQGAIEPNHAFRS